MQRVSTELLMGLTAILEAAERGSATRAAAELGVTTATALRRIEAAEQALGTKLFERLPTGLEPTGALEALLPWMEQALAAMRGMLDEVADRMDPEAGVVRVTSPPLVNTRLLAPAAAELRVRHPHVTLELSGVNTLVHLERLEADIAIRGVKPSAGDLVARKIFDFEMVVAGAPALVAAHEGAELGALPWLAWSREQGHLPEARWLEQVVPGAKVALHAADFVALFEAARAGMGVFLVPGPMARLEGLAILDGAPPLGPRGALWMVAHRALRAVGRVDCVWRWLIEHFARLKQQTWAAEHT